MQTKEYVFARIKNEFLNEKEELELFMFVGLSEITLVEQGSSYKKNVKIVLTKSIEMKVEEALPVYLAFDDHEQRVVIEKNEFERLVQLAEVDEIAFFTHEPHDIERVLDLDTNI